MSDAYQASIDAAAALPVVTDVDAHDDRVWFAKHPDRLFRHWANAGGAWLIRRRRQGVGPDVYLRTVTSALTPRSDDDGELAAIWYQDAYPGWPPERCRKSARKAIKRRGE
jgi:hypothetical protein